VSLWLEPAVFPVLLDSCVLYPDELRVLLLEAAHEQLYRNSCTLELRPRLRALPW
jgi:hypothetical protein